MDAQTFVYGYLARVVMIEVTHLHAAIQQTLQGIPVLVQGHVEDGHRIAVRGVHSPQQGDIPLDTRHQRRFPRLGEPKLLKGTDAVRITVENVEIRHVRKIRFVAEMKPVGIMGVRARDRQHEPERPIARRSWS
jgi:hypothetical protein